MRPLLLQLNSSAACDCALILCISLDLKFSKLECVCAEARVKSSLRVTQRILGYDSDFALLEKVFFGCTKFLKEFM